MTYKRTGRMRTKRKSAPLQKISIIPPDDTTTETKEPIVTSIDLNEIWLCLDQLEEHIRARKAIGAEYAVDPADRPPSRAPEWVIDFSDLINDTDDERIVRVDLPDLNYMTLAELEAYVAEEHHKNAEREARTAELSMCLSDVSDKNDIKGFAAGIKRFMWLQQQKPN
jgi:hypothetical protein